MSQVATIVYAAHDKAFLRTLQATDAFVYTLTREGALTPLRGPQRASVAAIPVRRVVWVGIPKRWVGKLGSLPFESLHVGAASRWTRVKNPLEAVAKIKEAFLSIESEGKVNQRERVKAHEDRVRQARVAALMAPPPYYVPQELR